MQAVSTVVSISKPALDGTLLLLSPDESQAQRLAARLRHLVTLRWADSHHLAQARTILDEQRQGLVLLDYSKGHAEISSEIARQLIAMDPDISLLGIGSTSTDRGAGVLAALRAGVKDFIDVDAPDHEVLDLLNTVLAQVKRVKEGQGTHAAARGQLILLCGVRPGTGTSTLAAHLGALAASAGSSEGSLASNRVMLLDLGHSRGDAGMYLGINSDFHVADALRHANRLDATLMQTAAPHHGSGLAVLGQSRESSVPLRDNVDVGPLVDRLLSMFDVVLCDLASASIQDVSPNLLQAADEIWLIADQGVGSLVSLDACLHELERANARDLRVSLVINRYDEGCGIVAPRIAERFGLPLIASLPERSRQLRASANHGALLHEVSPRDAYARALSPLLSRLRLRVKPEPPVPAWRKLIQRSGSSLWKRR